MRVLSVALPVRNGADYLTAALDSILAQTYVDFDLFVSDNASDDATAAILASYAARDDRVRVSRSAELIPQQANMNRAVELADTPWIKLFCHDDLMQPDCLARIADAIAQVEGSNVALIGNGERHLFGDRFLSEAPDTGELLVLPGREAIARKLWDVSAPIPFPAITTATVRRDAFAQIGGFDARYLYFDIFCWLEMLTRYDYAVDTKPLTVNRIHAGQVAQQARRSGREFRDFRAFLPAFVRRHGASLGMGARAKASSSPFRAKAIGTSGDAAAIAARAVAVHVRARRVPQAVATAVQIPAWYWPLLAILVPRAVRQERAMVRSNASHIPIELLYPA